MFERLSLCLLLYVASCAESRTWDGTFDKPIARPEHPRPDFRRDSFINLNTQWDFAYDPRNLGIEEQWFERDNVWTDRIQLPYAWEAPLSGLVPPHEGPYSLFDTPRATTYRGIAWYRLKLPAPLPRKRGLDWHLIFGAVDFKATAWINGKEGITHEGGYDPFSLNLSELADSDARATIVVRVEDFTELNDYAQPVGKQGGTWYTRTSGIWQTVYLEQRPSLYLASMRLTPDLSHGRIDVRLGFNRPASARIEVATMLNGELSGTAQGTFQNVAESTLSIALDHVETWDVEHPVLYDLSIRIQEEGSVPDVVHSYFGLVEIRTDWLTGHSPAERDDSLDPYKAVFVNGRPRYLRCVLDQSYYPDGIYTAPSVEAIRNDLQTAKDFEFNCIRMHIKTDEPVKYRLADEMGLHVLYDIPALDIAARNVSGFAGREFFEHVLRAAIERDANHPSVAAWVVFNENWGLLSNGSVLNPISMSDSLDIRNWVGEMVSLARSLDPTRPVEDNSAGGVVRKFEHVESDLNSFHYYGSDAAAFRAFLEDQAAEVFPGSTANFVGSTPQDGDPWLNSEFASFSTLGATRGPQIYCDLFMLLNEMRRQPKLVGWVLTELTDVEYELNGLLNYDRSPKPDLCERDGVSLKDVFGDDFIAFDWLPGHVILAGAPVNVPLRYSHWSAGSVEPRMLRIKWDDQPSVELSFSTAAFEVSPVTVPALETPETLGRHTLIAEVLDANGARVCANRIEVEVTASGGQGSITGAAR